MIRVSGGEVAEVWRAPTRDRYGDGQLVKVGTIGNVVVQSANTQTAGGFQETGTVNTVAYVPKTALRVEHRDRLKIKGHTYAVVSDRGYDTVHPMSGLDFGYYVVEVEASF